LFNLPKENDNMLSVADLTVNFYLESGIVSAVNHVSFDVRKRSSFGIVGESGSGKTVTALAIMGLLPMPPGKVDSGTVLFKGEELLSKAPNDMRKIRGNRITMIYQDPMTSLNPVLRVGFQIAESLMVHEGLPYRDAKSKAIELMGLTGISAADKRAEDYPHQFSGGMRQRIMIAMALATKPDLLIADEPTTALDVITQAQILALLKRLQAEYGLTVILITHDLGIVAELCDDIMVMYAGHAMERATARELYSEPQNPYTRGLLESITRADKDIKRLNSIPGSIPDLIKPPKGCRFHTRCPMVFDKCKEDEPPDFEVAANRFSKCWLATAGRKTR